MKNILIVGLLFFSIPLISINHTNDIPVSISKSKVQWTGSKPTGSHTGTINLSSGKLVFDHGRLVGGEFIINMGTIECTDIEGRKGQRLVEHLKNEDFFFVEKHPTARLEIVTAQPMPDNMYKILANLTIKDITHEVIFSSHLTIKGNQFVASAKIEIDRTKWGVVYKSGNVFKDLGDKIIDDQIDFDVFLTSE